MDINKLVFIKKKNYNYITLTMKLDHKKFSRVSAKKVASPLLKFTFWNTCKKIVKSCSFFSLLRKPVSSVLRLFGWFHEGHFVIYSYRRTSRQNLILRVAYENSNLHFHLQRYELILVINFKSYYQNF